MPAVTAAAWPASAGPRVLVVVGTDHHPFDRMVTWVNDWLGGHQEQAAGFFAQSGTAAVVPGCAWSPLLEVGRLDAMLDEADVVVCHGGPATIAGAWQRGLLPIVVPRLPQLGEHVDDHQLTFSRKLADTGRIWLAQTPEEFASSLASATSDPARLRASLPAADVSAAVARFGELVEELISRPRRRLMPWHRSTKAPRRPASGQLAVAASMPPGQTPQSSTSWNAHGGQMRAGLYEGKDEEQE